MTDNRTRATAARWILPALLIVAWLVVGGIGGPLQGQLSTVQRNDNAAFLPESAESTRVAELQKGFAEQSSLPAVLVFERPGGLTGEDQRAITAALAEVAKVPGVGPVTPLKLSTQDKDAAQSVALLPTGGEKPREVVADIRAELAGLPAGLAAHVTGPGGLIADFTAAFGGIDGLLLGVTAAVVALILVVVYRSPLLPFVVLLTAGLALCLAVAVVYALAKAEVLTLNGQSQGILFILVFGAATDYALLLIARLREELRRHESKVAATKAALRAAAGPIAASAGTVIAGLLCLLISDLRSNSSLGPVAAIGIAASLAAALTFLPAVLVLLGRAAFWPSRPRYGTADEEQPERGVWPKVAGLVGRRPRAVWLLSTLLLAIGVGFLPQLRSEGVAQSELFLTEVDSVTGQQVLARHFPAGTGSPAILITAADSAEEVVRLAKGTEGVADAGPRTARIVDGRIEITALLKDAADSPTALDTVQRLRERTHGVGGTLVGGPSASQLDVRTSSLHDRKIIIPVVLAVIFAILALLLRALLAPLLLIATVVLSFAATLGVSALVFNNLFDFPGADPSVPLFAFVFLVALGIDYNIFLMTRVREEALAHGTRDGALRGLTVTGGVITSAGVVLAATFAALAVLPILFLAQIAFLVAFGVLLDTLLVRSLLVPALTVDIGRKIWWPSKVG
ncbi:MMPL family transporter [Actinokineospora diospyrosa]|uniref:Drug exporter of the RND superfamily n=1 Tax=Actinokineospora diospyrosa TaxID=103728 RepID=A0ABT1I709_9PSEU|nr:MMPL family transporter [Actinokineospora diospyrosa]MCP2268406.1 putative drug exporter of the RND superfamily [Actinokineospora diospyrosa]